jgi:hypothetical protein
MTSTAVSGDVRIAYDVLGGRPSSAVPQLAAEALAVLDDGGIDRAELLAALVSEFLEA